MLKDEVMAEDMELLIADDTNRDGLLDSQGFAAFNSPED